MNPSRKSRNHKKRVFRMTKKWRGGQEASSNTAEVDKIKQEVEADKSLHMPSLNLGLDLGLGDSEILKTTGELAEGVTVNTLEGIGELAGVDLSDPQLVEKNKEKIVQMGKNAAEVGVIALEAAEPFAKPLIDKTVEAGGEALSKMGEAGVKVLLNTAEEIPGVGVVLGTVRSLSNIGEAAISSINAGSEVITTASDSLNAATKNFERLIKEKDEIANRTQDSVQQFTGGSSRKYRPPFLKNRSKRTRKHKKNMIKRDVIRRK